MAKAKDLPPGVPPDGAPVPADTQGAKLPPHGTQRPIADAAGLLPRVVDPLERVPGGSKARRYKCRVTNFSGNAEPKYVLALDAESARECHREASGVNALLQSLRDNGAKESDLAKPQVHVTELAD